MARGDGFESQAPDSFVIIQTTIVFLQREGGVVDDDYSSLVSHRGERAPSGRCPCTARRMRDRRRYTDSPDRSGSISYHAENHGRPGLNVFTVKVEEVSSGKPAPSLQAQLSTTHLDLDMGTDQVDLQPDGHVQYSAQGGLPMSGHWEIGILLLTSGATVHVASVKLDTLS